MWTTEVTRKTKAKKEKIWELWADVPHWKVWDSEVENSELFGQFIPGTKGTLKPSGGLKTKFIITECTKFKSFSDRSFLPFCKLDFYHSMQETPDGLLVKHKVVMSGLLSFLFSKLIGRNMSRGLPLAVENLIKIAETN
jgi:hypothetical protein